MQKLLLPLLAFLFFAFITSPINASSLEVSKRSSFSSSDLNFGGGDMVYIRVGSDGSGSTSRVLNIRDNQYSLIRSVDLVKSGNQFSASFNAPEGQGYYSLEAVIEGDGASSKGVKTIKVGNPSSANVSVNITSSVRGTKSINTSQSQKQETKNQEEPENFVSPTPEVFRGESKPADQVKPAKSNWFFMIFQNVFSFFWPFN